MTFRLRIVLAATAAVAIAVILACTAAWFVSRNALVSSVDDNLSQSVQQTIDSGAFDSESGIGALTQVTNATGVVLYQSSSPGLPVDATVMNYANGRMSGETFETIHHQGVLMREIITGLAAGQALGVGPRAGLLPQSAALQLAEPLAGVEQQLRHLGLMLVLIGASGVIIALILGLLVAGAVIGPLDDVTSSVEELAKTNDLSERLAEGGGDELGRLRGAFNSLLRSLERSQDQQNQLVLDASHELRTPLTSLRTNTEVLRRIDELDVESRGQLLDDVITQVTELTTLIGDLTELARGERQQTLPTRFRLDELVDDLVTVASTYGRTHNVEINVISSPCWVHAQSERVARAIGNLINNAIKWSPDGGVITITVEAGVVTVTDQGPGIHENDLPKIFDRFYRAPSARALPGSGLGLAIVAQVAEDEHGSVAASNTDAGGAQLTLVLPVVT